MFVAPDAGWRFAHPGTINHTAMMKPANTPPASRGSVWIVLYRFDSGDGTFVSGCAPHSGIPSCLRASGPFRTRAATTTGRRMILVPADYGQRTTARPRVRPQNPAPAFVNDEARRIRRHVSRDVSGARRRAPDHPWRRVTAARIVSAGPRVLASTTSTVARPRARRVPPATNRASHAAQHPRGHQVRPDYLPLQIAANCHKRRTTRRTLLGPPSPKRSNPAAAHTPPPAPRRGASPFPSSALAASDCGASHLP